MTHKPKARETIALRGRQALLLSLAAVMTCLFANPARAQFLGYTAPQTVTQQFTQTCTGALVPLSIPNIGQLSHTVNFAMNNSQSAQVYLLGGQGNTQVMISNRVSGNAGSVTATGYYPIVTLEVLCTSGTLTLTYSGSAAPTALLTGQADYSSYDFQINSAASAGVDYGTFVSPAPFSSTGGTIYFQWTGTGSSGATITVTPETETIGPSSASFTFHPVTTTGLLQVFQVPANVTSTIGIAYGHSGASTATYSLEYVFAKAGTLSTSGIPVHITGTTATAVKGAWGILSSIVVNTPAAGTVTLFDLAPADCTGTPSTNVVGVITVGAMDVAHTIPYGTTFNLGICLKASAGMDLTAIYQ